jgi:hypothetical protein
MRALGIKEAGLGEFKIIACREGQYWLCDGNSELYTLIRI